MSGLPGGAPEAEPSLAQARPGVPLPGEAGVLQAALAIGFLLLGVQLWLLTTALESYLAGSRGMLPSLAGISGLIWLGGVAMRWILDRRPQVRRSPGAHSLRSDEP